MFIKFQPFAGCCIPNAKSVRRQDGKEDLHSRRLCVWLCYKCMVLDSNILVFWIRCGYFAMTVVQTWMFGFIWLRISALAAVRTILDRRREDLILLTPALQEFLRLLVQPVNQDLNRSWFGVWISQGKLFMYLLNHISTYSNAYDDCCVITTSTRGSRWSIIKRKNRFWDFMPSKKQLNPITFFFGNTKTNNIKLINWQAFVFCFFNVSCNVYCQ